MPTLSAPMAEKTAYALPMAALCHVPTSRGNASAEAVPC